MKIFLHILRLLSVAVGYFGAMSFVRSMSTAFDWYTNVVFGGLMQFDFITSAAILLIALLGMAYSTWSIRRRKTCFMDKADLSVIMLAAGVGFYICYLVMTAQMLSPWEITQLTRREMTIVFDWNNARTLMWTVPAVAYLLAVFAFTELIARLAAKKLLSSLYWVAFFKTYGGRLASYAAAVLLAGQLLMLVLFRDVLLMAATLLMICASTVLAAFMLNLSKIYNMANEDKIRAERFKSELITNVSHDIKTPLTSIINYVDLLKSEDVQGKTADYVQVLDKKSARLKVLIDDLMEASKASTGNMRVVLQEINLIELVGQVAGDFEDALAEKGLTLVLRQPDEPMFYSTDSRHLHRVLENLFSNAEKYALGGTRVFVEITTKDCKPLIIMQNTSASPVGLTDGESTEQFMRGDKSRQTEGSGLGLYIAKSLVELLGGRLVIEVSGDLFRVNIAL